MVELPVDVLFAIIEEIGMQRKPDFNLLWAFCSTCRTLRPHAQKFLFHSLSFNFRKSRPRPFDFAMAIFWEHMEFILEQNPNIATSVKYVRFRVEVFMGISPRFATLLSKFTTLKTLRCGYEDHDRVAWGHLQDSPKQIWRNIFRLPSVQKLQILCINDIPVSVLFPCTSLQTLYLDNCASFGPPVIGEHVGILPNLPLTNIVSVQASNHFSAFDPIFTVYSSIGVPMVEKCNVKYLSVQRIEDEECHKFKDFSSLRSFSADMSHITDPRSLFTNFHPSSIQSLQSLTMEIKWDSHSEVAETCPEISLLVAAMGMHPIFPNLTGAAIGFLFGWHRSEIEGPLAELDPLFASTTRFPRLNTVAIKLNPWATSAQEATNKFWVHDSDNIKRCMPLVAARSKCTLVPLDFWEEYVHVPESIYL